MFRIIYLAVVTFLCSCNHSRQTDEMIRVAVLRGPSAIAFAGWMNEAPAVDGKAINVQIIDSPELMQAALIKGETDIAVLPMISAANLYNKGIRYPLLGCPVWGTLYLVDRKQDKDNTETQKTIHIFGAGTTPDILTRYYLQQHHREYTPNYTFATAPEIMQGLLAGKVNTAVLGEPFLSMALRKDTTLHIVADLNNPDTATAGFAQTAVIISPALEEKREQLDSLLQTSCRFATGQPLEAIRILENKQIFKTGMLTPESIERCKIDYKPARESKDNIRHFLQVINEYEPKALGGNIPDEGFYK